MNWRKIGRISAIFYMIVYVVAMFTPRSSPADSNSLAHNSFRWRILHEILYYGGALEPVANFLFLIPVFVFLVLYLGSSKAILAAIICVALSATAEFLQRFIPGRVTSLQDFLLNSLGALSALLIYWISFNKKVSIFHED
jgi:VanZ family protein